MPVIPEVLSLLLVLFLQLVCLSTNLRLSILLLSLSPSIWSISRWSGMVFPANINTRCDFRRVALALGTWILS